MKILVAGAGHGGLAAAGLLAKQGHSVTVFEREGEAMLGHDWTDIFNLACFSEAGIPLPPAHEYEPACEMTFFNPACTMAIRAYTPMEKSTESKMERRDILRHLIAFARGGGAELVFHATVEHPLLDGKRVAGLVVNGREELADLVIDAAGMNSPLRTQLPAELGVVRQFKRDEYFTIFRAFYNSTGKTGNEHPFCVYFLPMGRRGVAWFASEGDYVDLMCGSFEDTDAAYAEQVRRHCLANHPDMGDDILRGGSSAKVPVRRPISRMVADGYAAVGDSAGMTVPLNGSGITNSIRAGRLLAETVMASSGTCTAAQLWPYQVAYMHSCGAACASLDLFKRFMLTIDPGVVDFLFEKQILTAADMNKARTGQEITFTLPDLLRRGLRGAGKPSAMLGLAKTFAKSQKIKRRAMNIPAAYDEAKVLRWAKKYDEI